jgi:hypothetical protein
MTWSPFGSPPRRTRNRHFYRPTIEPLERRDLPAGTGFGDLPADFARLVIDSFQLLNDARNNQPTARDQTLVHQDQAFIQQDLAAGFSTLTNTVVQIERNLAAAGSMIPASVQKAVAKLQARIVRLNEKPVHSLIVDVGQVFMGGAALAMAADAVRVPGGQAAAARFAAVGTPLLLRGFTNGRRDAIRVALHQQQLAALLPGLLQFCTDGDEPSPGGPDSDGDADIMNGVCVG